MSHRRVSGAGTDHKASPSRDEFDGGEVEDDGSDAGSTGLYNAVSGGNVYNRPAVNEDETAESILGSLLKEKKSSAEPNDGSTISLNNGSDNEEEADSVMMEEMQNTLTFLSEQFGSLGSEGNSLEDGSAPGANSSGGSGGGQAAQLNGGGAAIVRIRQEYEKLHKLFLQSRRNEQALVKRCRDFSNELTANAAKVQAALRLSQNDRAVIMSLKKEVKKAWKMVEASSEKESRSAEAIARLKIEVDGLRRKISDGSSPARGGNVPTAAPAGVVMNGGYNKMIENQLSQEQAIHALTEERDNLQSQLEEAQSEVTRLEQANTVLEHTGADLLDKQMNTAKEMETLKDLLAKKKGEHEKEAHTRERLEQALQSSKAEIAKRDADVAQKSSEVNRLKEHIARVEGQIKDDKDRLGKEQRDKEGVQSKLRNLEKEYEDLSLDNTKLMTSMQQQTVELKVWEDQIDNYKENYKSMARVKEFMQKKVKILEESKMECEMERDTLRHLEAAKKQVEQLTRERDVAQKNFVKATGATQRQLGLSKLAEQARRNLEHEIAAYREEASKMRKLIYSLEKDRDRHANEAGKIEQDLVAKEEELKIKEMLVFDSRKKITEFERKLKEQQSLYENVRADRNLYSKNLVESQDEINEMKRKVKIMGHQIEQLKEEIASKDANIAKEHFEHARLEKEKESLAATIARLQQQLDDAQQVIQNRLAEENKLRHIIADADADRIRRKAEYETVVQERDILGTQLIRRNDELSLLYEKIKIQTSTLNKGEVQYHERLEDIRVLRLEIRRLRRERAILQTETQNVAKLRTEIYRLQRDILRERTRVKVLEEELESPMNVHRWRKLSGSDPSTFELISKVQALQRRLIAKTEEIVERDLVIRQRERTCEEIRDLLRRQPGPEVLEELRAARATAKAKSRECKSLASELNMYHSQSNEHRYEIERLTRELQEMKARHYAARQLERAVGAAAAADPKAALYPNPRVARSKAAPGSGGSGGGGAARRLTTSGGGARRPVSRPRRAPNGGAAPASGGGGRSAPPRSLPPIAGAERMEAGAAEPVQGGVPGWAGVEDSAPHVEPGAWEAHQPESRAGGLVAVDG
ncbi:hypothetical protein HK405_004919 [Cladochytrium tenue]|nr:hypothetical protein HK405_004919 [Cladochytrium tenue]